MPPVTLSHIAINTGVDLETLRTAAVLAATSHGVAPARDKSQGKLTADKEIEPSILPDMFQNLRENYGAAHPIHLRRLSDYQESFLSARSTSPPTQKALQKPTPAVSPSPQVHQRTPPPCHPSPLALQPELDEWGDQRSDASQNPDGPAACRLAFSAAVSRAADQYTHEKAVEAKVFGAVHAREPALAVPKEPDIRPDLRADYNGEARVNLHLGQADLKDCRAVLDNPLIKEIFNPVQIAVKQKRVDPETVGKQPIPPAAIAEAETIIKDALGLNALARLGETDLNVSIGLMADRNTLVVQYEGTAVSYTKLSFDFTAVPQPGVTGIELHSVRHKHPKGHVGGPLTRALAKGAAGLGLRTVELAAIRNDDDHDYGYNVWPKCGFDTVVPAAFIDAIRAERGDEFKDAVRWFAQEPQAACLANGHLHLSDLFCIDPPRPDAPPPKSVAVPPLSVVQSQMKALWRKHGDTHRSEFDVREGSDSWQMLERYERQHP